MRKVIVRVSFKEYYKIKKLKYHSVILSKGLNIKKGDTIVLCFKIIGRFYSIGLKRIVMNVNKNLMTKGRRNNEMLVLFKKVIN